MQSAKLNFPSESEQVITQTILLTQNASLTYDLLAATSAGEEVSMPGFCKFFRLCSLRTRKMSERWINWLVMRGGKLQISEINPLYPAGDILQQGIEKLLSYALETEKKLEQQMRYVHQVARSKGDLATAEFIENKFLPQQIYVIRMMVNFVNGLRVSQNAYIYDRTTVMEFTKKIHKSLLERHQMLGGSDLFNEDFKPSGWSMPQVNNSIMITAFIYPID
ncbi:unnamed protein product [Calicophoron daubneyi]|uniref:Ferritin n=1 Tax=Calicophoron daubneyi TaxID=300641 RepID=A0AAV2TYB9_CALDB